MLSWGILKKEKIMNIKNIECQPIKPQMNFGSLKKSTVKAEDKQIIQELTNKQSMKHGLSASGIVIGLVLLISYISSKVGSTPSKIKKSVSSIVKKPLLMLENKTRLLTPKKSVLLLENLNEKRNYINTRLFDLNKIRLKPI